MNRRFLLVFFSGTGSTKLVANEFEMVLIGKACEVIKHSLDMQEFRAIREKYNTLISEIDEIILIYAVHALDAPKPIYEWIEALPRVACVPVSVISVSGGGEVWPNTSCRALVIKALRRKGYLTNYERMMVMPSNIFISGSDHAVIHVLNKMPYKVEAIAGDILAGKKRRTSFKLGSRILMPLSKLEKKKICHFGEGLEADDNCTGCGWCEGSCPRENIHLEYGRPVFGMECVACLKCIYGCPMKSIHAKKGRFLLVKTGYDLDEIKKRMENVALEPVDKCCKGLAWLGVRKYLKDKD